MRSLRKTTESYIRQANLKHNNFYNYPLVNYTGCNNLIDIICPIHGQFQQKAFQHLHGNGCYECGRIKTINGKLSNTEDFIQKANVIHNNKYTYQDTNYKGAIEHVVITCPVHGNFHQRPNYHLSGNGCYQCYKDRNGFGKQEFIEACRNNIGRLYIIKCFLDREVFYKIGITSKSIKERFKTYSKFPYKYKVIYEKVGIAEDIYDLEKTLHRKYKSYKYTPKILFKGSTECFKLTRKIIRDEF